MASTLAHTANQDNAPGRIHQPVNNSKKQGEKAPDNRTASVADSAESIFWVNYYDNNKEDIDCFTAGIASLSKPALQNSLSGFWEVVSAILEPLEELSKIHPIAAGVVVAFRLIVTLYRNRSENDQKVTALDFQMTQMMNTLLRLRDIKDQDDPLLGDHLQPLMESIEKDIRECGSFCDFYQTKKVYIRIFKSEKYKAQFAEYAAKFIAHSNELNHVLIVRTTLGLDKVSAQIQTMNDKVMGLLQKTFDGLDTQLERSLSNLIKEKGGSDAFVGESSDHLIRSLIEKSGEKVDFGKNPAGNRSPESLTKKDLRKELTEDIKVALERNMEFFEQKLDLLDNNLAIALERHGEYIVDALSKGAYAKIKDPDLQNLWKEMDWKGTVKARNFVLALHEYFTNQFAINTPRPPATSYTPTLDSPPALRDDRWALKYLPVTNLHSILQAVDDDGTGFISIKEANTFSRERPPGWSLLQWIAFWAKGWEMTTAKYKNKIIPILQEMDSLLQCIPTCNKRFVIEYLHQFPFASVQVILQSVNATMEHGEACEELLSDADLYMTGEEARLQKNLETIGYNVDTAATVTLVTGPGRIERYLLPLLYLMLKRHLGVFHYACRHLVDEKEFWHMSKTLQSIFDVVERRIQTLTAIHKHLHKDRIYAPVDTLGFGMFHDVSISGFWYGSRESLLMTWHNASRDVASNMMETNRNHPEQARPLFWPEVAVVDSICQKDVWAEWLQLGFDTSPFTGGIDGFWNGSLRTTRGRTLINPDGVALTQLKIEIDPSDGSCLLGSAITYRYGRLEVKGRRRWLAEGTSGFEQFDIIISTEEDNESATLRLVGKVEQEAGVLVGEWISADFEDIQRAYGEHSFRLDPPELEDEKADEALYRAFEFHRTPVDVYQFRPILSQGRNKTHARWDFLRESVLYRVRRQTWSQSFFKSWLADRRTFRNFLRRSLLSEWGYVIDYDSPLTLEERQEFNKLLFTLPPVFIQDSVEAWVRFLLISLDHLYVTCDGCELNLTELRFICLTCVEPDMSNSFDLCLRCVDKPSGRGRLIHTVDHILIKTGPYFLPYWYVWVVNKARSTTTRLKKMFVELLSKDGQDIWETDFRVCVSKVSRSQMLCFCCGRSVEIPFWICLTCAPEIYICNDCEGKEVPKRERANVPPHHPNHLLLRLHNLKPDTFETGRADPQAAALAALGTAMGTRMHALELRIGELEERLKVSSSVESLLKGIALHLGVPGHDKQAPLVGDGGSVPGSPPDDRIPGSSVIKTD